MRRKAKLKTAVVGVGYLGRIHAEKYRAIDNVDLIAVCDLDEDVARSVAESVETDFVCDPNALVGRVDAVTIAASTPAHFALAKLFLENGVHVLVEKPMTSTSDEARILVALAEKKGLKLQVGHVERFNPALLSARESLTDVRFIECHRLAPYKSRSTDTDVVFDLMIHDLDVILSLVNSRPTFVSAVGIPVLTDKIDIASARIEFENRATANVTASRVSTSAQRKFRVIQTRQYVSIDFGAGQVQRVTSDRGAADDEPALNVTDWSLEKGDALLDETRSFVDAIVNDTDCAVSGSDGLAALELAETILERISQRWD
jgi:predicted dehydrogenase